MDWSFVARFSQKPDDLWITPYVPGTRHQFHIIPRDKSWADHNWHLKQRRGITGYEEWQGIWQQSGEAFDMNQTGGVITAFPQLAAAAGLRQRLARKPIPVVAWCFNMGACYPGIRGWLAQSTLKDINRFVVHSRRERESYSQWLRLPLERFEFVPFQVSTIPIEAQEENLEPFVLAMGSAQRDYGLLFEAVRQLGLRTIVVAGPLAVEGLTIPSNVEVRRGLTMSDCYRLAQQARINVVPLLDKAIATGPSTIVAALRMGRPTIATQTTGSEDYIIDGETGLLTAPGSVDQMVSAIDRLWHDQDLRHRLGTAAAHYAAEHFSDEAAGTALGRILDTVADEVGQY